MLIRGVRATQAQTLARSSEYMSLVGQSKSEVLDGGGSCSSILEEIAE